MSRVVEKYRQEAKLGWPEVNVTAVYEIEPSIPARGDNAPEDGSCTVLEVFVGGVDILGLLNDDQIMYLEQVCFKGHGK